MDLSGTRRVRDLLARNPRAAVAVIDPARELGDARGLLAAAGIDIGTHTMLRGTALAEFVAPIEAAIVGDIVADAGDQGAATRSVHLRDGREAALHLIRVDELHLPTGFVMVLVPESDGPFPETALPSAIEPAARVGVLCVDGGGIVTRADDAVVSVLGRARSEIEGSSVIHLAQPDDHEAVVVHWVAAKERRGVAHRWRGRVVRGDGSLLWAEVTITNRIDDLGSGDVRVEINDISREMAAADALAVERQLLKELTESLPVGVAKFDTEGRIEYANAQLARLLGRDPAAVVKAAITGAMPDLAGAFSQLLCDGEPSRFVAERRPESPDRDLEWTLRPVTSAAGAVIGGVLCVADVTEAIELRAAVEERATTDAAHRLSQLGRYDQHPAIRAQTGGARRRDRVVVPRPRWLQGDQRRARPRGRRPNPRDRGVATARRGATARHHRPPRG